MRLAVSLTLSVTTLEKLGPDSIPLRIIFIRSSMYFPVLKGSDQEIRRLGKEEMETGMRDDEK